MLPHFYSLKATIHSITTDTESNRIVIHASSAADTIAGPFNNEYIFILHVTDDGSKLKEVEEYIDSFKAKEQNPRLRAAIAKANENGIK